MQGKIYTDYNLSSGRTITDFTRPHTNRVCVCVLLRGTASFNSSPVISNPSILSCIGFLGKSSSGKYPPSATHTHTHTHRNRENHNAISYLSTFLGILHIVGLKKKKIKFSSPTLSSSTGVPGEAGLAGDTGHAGKTGPIGERG